MKGKKALLVVDMLNDFVKKGAPLEVPSTRSILPSLKQEIEAARSSKQPVIFICDSHKKKDPEFEKMGWPAHAVEGTEGAKIVQFLKPLKRDFIVQKKT